MLKVIIVMFEGRSRIVRRINVYAFDLSGIERQKRLQCFKIVAMNEDIVIACRYIPTNLCVLCVFASLR